jgi:hypothetical protein
MKLSARTRTTLAVAVAAVSLAPAALGQGEPKNEPPFTSRYSADPGLALALREAANLEGQAPFGERKNGVPFTHRVTVQEPILAVGSNGFRWTDAAIGSAATFGFCLVCAGAALAVRRPRFTGSMSEGATS